MHIELIDLLRCPKDHEETWLVAALTAVQDRFVIKAKLGCPVCGVSYSISNGIADLRIQAGDHSPSHTTTDSDDAVRIAALLNLTRPGAVAVLEGDHAAVAQNVSDMTESRIIESIQLPESKTRRLLRQFCVMRESRSLPIA